VEIDADVEPAVIPICLVVPAPLAGSIHPGYVAVHLPAMLAMTADVMVDSGPVGLEAASACFAMVLGGANIRAEGKQQSSCDYGTQQQTTPDFFIHVGIPSTYSLDAGGKRFYPIRDTFSIG
jgi:hypothetical protein